MKRKLYVHVGPIKTATSAIQTYLRDVESDSIVYPKVGLGSDGSHHKLVYKFFGEHRQAGRLLRNESVDSLFGKIALEDGDGQKNILVSSELLASESRDAGEFIRALAARIRVPPADVRIVLVCREHFARAASWYNMRVRAPKHRNPEQRFSPDRFLDARAAEICYEPMVRRLKGTGFPVVALEYHPADTVALRFFALVGLSEIPQAVDRQREGLSTKALIATLATNLVTRSLEERQTLLAAFAGMSGARGPCGFIFGRAAAERAEVSFARDRNFLKEEFGFAMVAPVMDGPLAEFELSREEFQDISVVAREFGSLGKKILEVAGNYVRE